MRRRPDFASLSEVRARALLVEHQDAVERTVGRYATWLRDDLRQVARIAVCEAAVSWHPTGVGARSLRSWIWRVVRWRVAEAAQTALQDAPIVDGADPGDDDERPYTAVLRGQVTRCVDRLSTPRYRVLVELRLQGESYPAIARSLGLSQTTVYRQTQEALDELRQLLGLPLDEGGGAQ